MKPAIIDLKWLEQQHDDAQHDNSADLPGLKLVLDKVQAIGLKFYTIEEILVYLSKYQTLEQAQLALTSNTIEEANRTNHGK